MNLRLWVLKLDFMRSDSLLVKTRLCYYIPSSNLLFCGLWCDEIYDEIYDETYGVIYEIVMRKFRASMEPFCDLEISKHVE